MVETRILVTGAPGNVGTEVVRELQQSGIAFRVGARNVTRSREILGEDVDIVSFDFLKPDTYTQAFDGITQMFLVRPPTLANVQRDIAPAIRAAVGAGVKHVVFLSIQGVEQNTIVPHHKIEQLVQQMDIRYSFLRAGFFMQNLTTIHCAEIRDRDEIAVPVGKARTSFIDVRDIASVAVRLLTRDGHENQKYTLTGAESLDYAKVAHKLSTALKRPIRYTNPSVITFLWRQMTQGQAFSYSLLVTVLYTITRFGNAKDVTDDVETILGRSPILFDQFALDYRALWQGAEGDAKSS